MSELELVELGTASEETGDPVSDERFDGIDLDKN